MAFLKALFGPSREEMWRKLADEVGASYVDGGFWKGDKVDIQHGEWTITLDTYTVSNSTGNSTSSTTYTRLRAPYVNPEGFQFTIYRKGLFSSLGKLFGMQDVEVGFAEFDENFIIKGNDERKLKALFANERIRGLIHSQPSIHFTVKDDEGWFSTSYPDGVDCLNFHVVGVLKETERLKTLYWLFAETLDHLCHIGAAYEDNPNVELK
jgi:hypothetical protein